MTPPCSSDDKRDRRSVGYMLRMYPRFTQTFVVNEILELERQKVDVKILSLRKPTDGKFHASISRVCAKADYLPEHLVEAPRKIMSAHWPLLRARPSDYWRSVAAALRYPGVSGTDLFQAAMVLRWARKRKVDHIHVHFGTNEASVAYLACLMGGLSYSLTLHAFDIFRDNVDRDLLARKINASRFTVTVSEYNRRFLSAHFPDVDIDRVRVNYNGIDLERFGANGAVRRGHTILGVGRLIEKKGFVHLVRAVGRLRTRGLPVVCRIVGDGPQETMLNEVIRELGLEDAVTLTGLLPQSRVGELMAESACFVLPCVHAADGNVDALPTVLLEAMACGCPCVSTTVSGVPEIIEHGHSGLLVAPGDDEALADAMGRILQHADTSTELACGGRQRIESRFDVRQAVGRMNAWFAEVMAVKPETRTRPVETMRIPAA